MLHRIIVWFYCLPILDAFFLIFVLTCCFQILNKSPHYPPLWKSIKCILLSCCIVFVVFTTVSGRESGNKHEHYLIPFHSYRALLNGSNIEILRSNFMNIVLFYPAGLLMCSLLSEKWYRWCRVLLVFVILCALSAGIEYVQYAYSLGWVEIDDVIHNSLGALLGAIFSMIPLEPWRWFQIIPPSE